MKKEAKKFFDDLNLDYKGKAIYEDLEPFLQCFDENEEVVYVIRSATFFQILQRGLGDGFEVLESKQHRKLYIPHFDANFIVVNA